MVREPQNADDPSECSELNTGMPYISSASKQNTVEVSNGESSKVFGMRRRHRCFVVTARARSFLYHQVSILYFFYGSFSTSFLFTVILFIFFGLF